MNEEKNHIIYTAEDIKRYITGEMPPAEMHAIEMAALDDPLLAEAMEGYELMEQKDWSKELAALKQQFNKKNETSPVIPISKAPAFKWWRVAAAAVVLGITATTAYIFTNKSETAILQDTAKAETAVTVTDSSAEVVKTDSVASFLNTAPADSSSQLIAKLDRKTVTASTATGSTVTIAPATVYGATTDDNANRRSDSVRQSSAGSDYFAVNDKRAVAKDVSREKEYKAGTESSAAAAPGKISATGNSDIAVNERDFKNKAEEVNVTGYDKNNGNKAITSFGGVVVTPDNKPLSYAGIKATQDKKTIYADANGMFHIAGADTTLKVTVSSAGYMSQEFTLQNLAAQNKIVLQPQDVATQKIGAYRNRVAAKKQQQSFADSTDLDDEDAEPAGGWVEYNNYLNNNIKLTEDARQKNVHGEVEVTVKLKDNGDISTVKVAKPLSPELDAEAVRLVKEGPKWDTKGNKKTKVKVKVKF